MTCIDLDIPIPPIPDIFVAPPLVPKIPLPVSGTFCCKFTLNDIAAAQAVIAGINAAIGAAGGEANSIIGTARAELLAIMLPLMQIKHLLGVSCPLNDLST